MIATASITSIVDCPSMVRVPTLRRRRFLIASGAMVAIAGCTGSGDDENGDDENGDDDLNGGDDLNGDDNGDDENGDDNGDEADIDAPHPTDDDHGYDVETYEGVDIPIVPIEDALEWHEADLVHFFDARGSEDSHENARIPGSVWSTYPDGDDDDPVDEWESDDPIVVYSNEQSEDSLCTMKGSELIEDGFEYVYVMDEGFGEWRSRDYPMEGLGPDGELEGDDEDELEGDDEA